MLLVKSVIGTLHHAETTIHVGSMVAALLVQECRSFYCEPQPFDRMTITTDPEHAPRVLELIKAYS